MKTMQFKLKGYNFKLKNGWAVSFLETLSNVIKFPPNRLDCDTIIFVCFRIVRRTELLVGLNNLLIWYPVCSIRDEKTIARRFLITQNVTKTSLQIYVFEARSFGECVVGHTFVITVERAMISDWSNQGACPSSYIKKANGCLCIPWASHRVSNGLSLHAPRQRCRVTNRGKCRAFLSSGWGTSTASGRGLQGALSRYTGSGEGSVEFDLRADFPKSNKPEREREREA